MSKLDAGLRSPQIPALFGLRAIAVSLVILLHSGFTQAPGGLGVLLFFVISGFLITWLLLKEDAKRGSVSLRRFYIRRSLRIFPAFYVYCFGFLAILLVLGKPVIWPQVVASALYVNNYYQAFNGDPSTFLSHTWSLGIEEQFYLGWPALFLLLRRRPQLLVAVLSLLIAIVWVYRLILKLVFRVWQGYFYEAFDTRMDHLLIGCLLAILLFHYRKHRAWTWLCERPLITAATFLFLVLSVIAENRWSDTYRDTVGFIVNPVLCALLIPQLISLTGSPLTGWLDARLTTYLGTISYSLYLYQQVILEGARKAVHFLPFSLQFTFSIALLIAIASGSYYFVEKPFLQWKDRRFHS